MILVIGATAQFGRQTVEALAAAGRPVRALTRNPQAAGLPEGVEVVRGDLTDTATLAPALEGVSELLLVLPYGLEAGPVLTEAQRAGVRQVVFLSSGAVVEGAVAQPDVIAAYHARVEEQIKASGLEWTFLRLMFPAINALSWAMQLTSGDVVRGPYAGASASVVHEQDVAEAAAGVLGTSGHAGRAYELTGPQSLTQGEQLAVLGGALGRELSFEEVPDGPVRQQLSQFMDGDFINALLDLMAQTVGKPAAINDVVEQLTGHPARTFDQWAADHAADFS
ncbi:NAD(P)H-binding protein [Streptomyces sp. S.PB5]|uniref:NmrA family NAD(P)-binding protein n=1 Tax=Streptomyces sp. S.PB5 TaxID=3020844 RepID=UPI0025B25FE2|nr:NAD(P)H-binding protein [Streptomyces sp. S.PB5]MDN3029592.1 NAD(P)H-binding protein [Streptomyces sp. S.PB5]